MSLQIKFLLANIGAIGIMVAVFFIIIYPQISERDTQAQSDNKERPITIDFQNTASVATTNVFLSTTSVQVEKITVAEPTKTTEEIPVSRPKMETKQTPENRKAQSGSEVRRVKRPYPFAPQPLGLINEETRLALVNILCAAKNDSLRPISGSGVIIDPRGVILTNAHVAQYVLLSKNPDVNLSCVIRGGAPARPLWNAEILFIPPVWVEEHANEITLTRATSTGEHDYALLRITGTSDGSQMPIGLAYLPPDTREAIGFIDDPVLVAGYPAEFIGGLMSQFNLFPVSSFTNIKDLLTFTKDTIDVLSLGGVIEAQSGSSGGPVTNAWGRLVGIITTTSEGATTAQRDLRAVTLSYINRDLTLQSGFDLQTTLGGDTAAQAAAFNSGDAQVLIKLLSDKIGVRSN